MVRRSKGRELNPEDFRETNEDDSDGPNLMGIIGQVKSDEEEEEGMAGSRAMVVAPSSEGADAAEEQWDDSSSDEEAPKTTEQGPADSDIENDDVD